MPIAFHACEIRRARPADAARLSAIDADVSVHPWSVSQFAAVCADADATSPSAANTVLVAEQGDLVNGFVVLSRVLDEASILNIAVHPEQQGSGLGRALLDAAFAELLGAGVSRCLLEVRESNTVARNLYNRYGFELDGVRRNYYPARNGREDALLMSRQLQGNKK